MQLRSLVFWLGLLLVGLMFYTEMVDESTTQLQAVQDLAGKPDSYFENAEHAARMRNWVEEIRTVYRTPTVDANKWADRMQIVFAFAMLFNAGFMLERDRISRSQEVLNARPLTGQDYVTGKYLGAVLPTLGAALLCLIAAVTAHIYFNTRMGLPWGIWPFVRAGLVLLAPTIMYAGAAAVLLSTVLRPVAIVPLYVVYEVLSGVAPIGSNHRMNLTTFIARTENQPGDIWTWSGGLGYYLLNRVFYLALAAGLLWLGARLWERYARGRVAL